MARVMWAHRRLIVLTCAATLVVLSSLALIAARAQPGGDDPPGFEVYREIHRLRVDVHDYPAARALAERFLARHPDHDLLRQAVEFEYAAVFSAEQNWATALPLFETVVDTYLDAGFEEHGEFFLVDDAQFFIGVVRQASGDPQGAIAAYEFLLDRFPTSNRHASGIVRLASTHQSLGQVEAALQWFQQVVAQHPEADFAPEAQLHVGNCYRSLEQHEDAVAAYRVVEQRWPDSRFVPNAYLESGFAFMQQKAYQQASDAFMTVVNRWPDSTAAPDAIQHANRALIHGDLDRWASGPGPGEGGALNAVAIEANLERLLASYPASPCTPGATLDAINYFVQPDWWSSGAGPQGRAKGITFAERLLTLYPDAKESCAARCELAEAILADNPGRAQSLIEAAIQYAVENEDPALYAHGLFARGAFLLSTGQPQAARAAFEELLGREPSMEVEAEAKLAIAHAYAREGDLQAALAFFEAVAGDPAYREDVRGAAALGKAEELWAAGLKPAAFIALDYMLQAFPDNPSTPAALELQALWSQSP